MEIDDLAIVGFAHPHVVDRADEVDFRRDLDQRIAYRRDAPGRGVAAGLMTRLQRLDMGFDLDSGSQLLADRLFQPAGNFVGRAER